MKALLRIKEKFLHILLVFLFFFIFFTLINWIETLLFEQVGITPFRFIEVFLAAALIAKIVLIVDHLPWVNLFRSYPLIYGILWKTWLYWVFLWIIRLLIRYVPFFFQDQDHLGEAFKQFYKAINWDLFISIQVYYLMLLFIFVTFQELTFKIGPKKIRHLFLGF